MISGTLSFGLDSLDRDKRQSDAIASNAGHCLWSGIVSPERARDVVEQLLRPAMFSGWGIRTYAADQPGYNPIGYHTGTVWPHDASIIAGSGAAWNSWIVGALIPLAIVAINGWNGIASCFRPVPGVYE